MGVELRLLKAWPVLPNGGSLILASSRCPELPLNPAWRTAIVFSHLFYIAEDGNCREEVLASTANAWLAQASSTLFVSLISVLFVGSSLK